MKQEALVVRPYHGSIVASRAYGGLKLMEAIYAPNVHLPKHSHAEASFCLILKGGYTETYGNLHLVCSPAHLKYQPASEPHTDKYGTQEGRSFVVELNQEWLDKMRDCSISVASPALLQNLVSVSILAKLRRELHHSDDVSALSTEGLMLEVIADLARKSREVSLARDAQWLKQVKDLLHDRFTERLSLSEIARFAGVHPVYLASSFSRRYRCTIGDYLRKLRIDLALRLIAESNQPLTEVALAAGFSNQSHFTRIFKQHTGQTPGQFRAMLRS